MNNVDGVSRPVDDVTKQKVMPKPTSDIDLQSLTTFPHVSSDYMRDNVKNMFREYAVDKDGNYILVKDLWAVMELFTQDFRVANLNKEESFYVRFNIDLCSDILITMPQDFYKPALILFERSTSITETSQSTGGFLRRMFNSFFSSSSTKDDKPVKRSFFGLGKKKDSE